MMPYILKSALCLGLIYGVYKLLLEREKMALFNRWFLLFGLLFSFIIPLIRLEFTAVKILAPIPMKDLIALELVSRKTSPSLEILDWMTLLYSCYVVVACLLLVRFLYHLNQLYLLVKQHPVIDFRGAKLVLLKEDALPYTFCQYIFVSQATYEQGELEEELYLHELTHARQWHSMDVLLIELLQVFFWFNPLLLFYKRVIQLNHEFLADDAVIQQFKTVASYQHLLLDKISPNQCLSLTSNLNFLLTKKRLKMMTKSTSWFRACSLASVTMPLFFALLFLFSNKVEAQVGTKKQAQLKDNYFQYTTIVCEKNANKKIYKPYADLTKKEKEMLPPPPPKMDGNKTAAPLPKGTLVYWGEDDKVTIGFASTDNIPPPPPPLAPPVPPTPPTPPTPK